MSAFQIIIVVVAIIFTVQELYFSITGRILANKRRKIDDERYKEQTDFKSQVDVLTKRLGEVMTENTNLNNYLKSWIASANDWKQQYSSLLKEKEEIEKTLKLERTPKKGGE
jgi:predicted nuclease with TOPRIM domain